jgi:glutathione S-transferase
MFNLYDWLARNEPGYKVLETLAYTRISKYILDRRWELGMTITVYELDGINNVRFSPFCWRTLLALKHKGIHDFERIPVSFRDRSPITFSGQERIPVLTDGDHWVNDSWHIACHLENAYPDGPTLFGSDIGRSQALFVNAWTQRIQNPGLINIILWDTFQAVNQADRDWWWEDREKKFGPIEKYKLNQAEKIAASHQELEPLRVTLRSQPFLGGQMPAYVDYLVFGTFLFARFVGREDVIEADGSVWDWYNLLLDMFDGFARQAPTA